MLTTFGYNAVITTSLALFIKNRRSCTLLCAADLTIGEAGFRLGLYWQGVNRITKHVHLMDLLLLMMDSVGVLNICILNMFPLYRFECSMWRWTLESIVPKCFSYHWYRLWVGAKLLGQLCCTIHIFNTIFERSRKLGFDIADVGRSHFSAHPRFSESDPARGDLCEAFWRVWVSENYFFHLFPSFSQSQKCHLVVTCFLEASHAALLLHWLRCAFCTIQLLSKFAQRPSWEQANESGLHLQRHQLTSGRGTPISLKPFLRARV